MHLKWNARKIKTLEPDHLAESVIRGGLTTKFLRQVLVDGNAIPTLRSNVRIIRIQKNHIRPSMTRAPFDAPGLVTLQRTCKLQVVKEELVQLVTVISLEETALSKVNDLGRTRKPCRARDREDRRCDDDGPDSDRCVHGGRALRRRRSTCG